MEVKTILIIVAVVILLYLVLSYVMKDAAALTNITTGTTMQKIEAKDLDGTGDAGQTSTNFTYSIWFYLDDWNYRYGEPKILFARSTKNSDNTVNADGTATSTTGSSRSGSSDSSILPQPSPSVVFGAMQNNMTIALTCFNEQDSSGQGIVHNCNVANFPLQKWVNLLISVYGRAMDVYLDGKLVKTCMLPGVPKIDSTLPAYITPMGGFSGWTSTFQYWKDSTNPQQAWNIYQKGYGASMLSSILSKYTIKISLMEGETETNSLEI